MPTDKTGITDKTARKIPPSSPAKTERMMTVALGFALGGAGAWGLHSHFRGTLASPSGNAFAGSVSAPAGAAHSTDGSSGGVAAAWEALTASGQRGLALDLSRMTLVARASSRDMPRLLELAGTDKRLRSLLLRRWTELDLPAAVEWSVPLLERNNKGDEDVTLIFSAWALKDPAAAMARLKAHCPVEGMWNQAQSVLRRLLEQDMAAGVRFGALSGPSRGLDQERFPFPRNHWVAKDPAKAAALLSALPPSEFRDQSISMAIQFMSKNDFPAALALLEKFPHPGFGRDRGIMWREAFYREWAKRDPGAMRQFMDEKADALEKMKMKPALFAAMGEKDPLAAMNWALENLPRALHRQDAHVVLRQLATDDPSAALDLLSTLGPGGSLTSGLDVYVESLPDRTPDALLAQARNLPEGPIRQALTVKAWSGRYEKDPTATLQALSAQPSESLPPGMWTTIGRETSSFDKGMELLPGIPPDAAPDFLSGLLRKVDMAGIGKFTAIIDSLTDPDQRAAAIGAMAPQIDFDPGAAIPWAQTLPPDERRLVAEMIEKSTAGLPPLRKKELLDPLR